MNNSEPQEQIINENLKERNIKCIFRYFINKNELITFQNSKGLIKFSKNVTKNRKLPY